ncbi:MAG: hemopexin repeat-containing protein [Paracoccaceae bacterium]|nr:hemopexin repeat-containing protein [Paracoccaceae bacterium]
MSHDIRFLGAALAHIEQDDPETIVRDAIDLCESMAEDASAELMRIRTVAGGRPDEDIDEVKEAYFNSPGKAFEMLMGWNSKNPERTLRKLAKRLDEVFRRIGKGLTVKCRPRYGRQSGRCKGGESLAYQMGNVAGGPKTFHLCPSYFDRGSTSRAAIVAHELCHAIGGFGGTLDLRNSEGEKIYGKRRAMDFARAEPDRACISPENVEQLLYYRERLKDQDEFVPIPDSIWAGLPNFIDAAVDLRDGRRVFFKGRRFWEWDPTSANVSSFRRLGEDGWDGVPREADGALRINQNQVVFYKGPVSVTFDTRPSVNGVVDVGQTPAIGDMFQRLLGVDAAVALPDTDEALLFRNTYVQRLDLNRGRITGSRRIWDVGFSNSGDLYGYYDAVVTGVDDRLHFFTAGHVQRRDIPRFDWG